MAAVSMSTLLWCIVCLTAMLPSVAAGSQDGSINKSSPFYDEFKCKKGLFVPKWEPSENIALGDRIARAIVYFFALCYLFLGVSIIAERFMSSIEVITAKEKEVSITKHTGEKTTLRVKIWNETVSNLTLMALGSSAPEIMLTAIEIVGEDFQAGELGPGTIVGSAAFNLFIIIGLCIFIIPSGEVRRIKHLRVFFVTATWSIVAYLWLYLIVATISPGVIKIWEGVVTLLLFPLTVGTAYIADRYLIKSSKRPKMYRPSRHHNVVIEMEGESDVEEINQRPTLTTRGYVHTEGKAEEGESLTQHADGVLMAEGQALTEELVLFEDHRSQYIDILRELRHKHPSMKMRSLESLAEKEVTSRGPKSRAYYRIQATRKLTGGTVHRRKSAKETKPEGDGQVNKLVTSVVFEPAHYTVMENIGAFEVFVKRNGGNLNNTVYVDYYTEDGTANAGSDYEHAQGTLTFEPGEIEKKVRLTILDDDIYEEDEYFYVKLGGLKYSKDNTGKKYDGGLDTEVMLGTPAVATIMILDDDHPGIFHFEHDVHNISEAVGECHVKVTRSSGARGVVKLPYRTVDGTAKAGLDYTETRGELMFSNNEYQKIIRVPIADRENYERSGRFHIEILEPSLIVTPRPSQITEALKLLNDPNDMTEEERVAEMGKPRLGDITRIEINITESEDFKKTVDKLLDRVRPTFFLEPSTWVDQFKQAVTVTSACESSYGDLESDGGEEKDEAADEETSPTVGDYVMHYMSLFWKLVFATVPPTDYGGGWWCFVLSIVWIGVLTGIINDLASAFGCTIRLKDSVTAVTFVALGTSVPDTFASKVAAIGDKYADSSIGNVTGSNAVNVFLGIGVAWTMAAVVNAFRGQPFEVRPGNLAFSLTIFCSFAITAIVLILFRRSRFIGGELGGPYIPKVLSSLFLVTLWIMYITLSSLEAYDVISGF